MKTQRDIEMKAHVTKKLPAQHTKPKPPRSLISRLQDSYLMRNKVSVEAFEARYAKKDKGKETKGEQSS